jgi:hypothetical protein
LKKKISVSTTLEVLNSYFLAVAMTAEDWESKYKEVWEKYLEEKKRTDVLKDRMITKQERYI